MYNIVTSNNCSWCKKTKALLKSKGLRFKEYNVHTPQGRWALTLMRQAGLNTVPQVFGDGGIHIGGHTELVAHLSKPNGTTEVLGHYAPEPTLKLQEGN